MITFMLTCQFVFISFQCFVKSPGFRNPIYFSVFWNFSAPIRFIGVLFPGFWDFQEPSANRKMRPLPILISLKNTWESSFFPPRCRTYPTSTSTSYTESDKYHACGLSAGGLCRPGAGGAGFRGRHRQS